jgi:hypothetical protein
MKTLDARSSRRQAYQNRDRRTISKRLSQSESNSAKRTLPSGKKVKLQCSAMANPAIAFQPSPAESPSQSMRASVRVTTYEPRSPISCRILSTKVFPCGLGEPIEGLIRTILAVVYRGRPFLTVSILDINQADFPLARKKFSRWNALKPSALARNGATISGRF